MAVGGKGACNVVVFVEVAPLSLGFFSSRASEMVVSDFLFPDILLQYPSVRMYIFKSITSYDDFLAL